MNNIGQPRSCALMKEYELLLKKLHSLRSKVVINGVLPRIGASNEWCSRALALNLQVWRKCNELGFTFADYWGKFYGNRSLFAQDGLHFNRASNGLLHSLYEELLGMSFLGRK